MSKKSDERKAKREHSKEVDKANAKKYIQHPTEVIKDAVKDAGKDLKKLEDAAKNAVGKVGEAAAKAAHEAAAIAMFVPLHIFEPIEKAALKKKGINITNEKAPQIAGLFVKHVIAGDKPASFESLEHSKKHHAALAWFKKGHHFEHLALLEHTEEDENGNVDDGSADIAQAVSDAIANAQSNNNNGGGSGGGDSGGGGGQQPYNPMLNPYATPAIIAAATNPAVIAAAATPVPINTSTGLPLTPHQIHVASQIAVPVHNNTVSGRYAAPQHRVIGRRHLEYFQLYDTLLTLKNRGVDVSHLNTLKSVKNAAIKNGVYHFDNIQHMDVADVSKIGELVTTGAGAIKTGNSQVEDAAFKAADLLAQNSGIPGADMIVTIIHHILDYIKGNQNKKKGIPLTADEAKLLGQKPADNELAASADQVQDQLVAIGVGNLKSTDKPPVKTAPHLNLFERISKAINPKGFAKKHPDVTTNTHLDAIDGSRKKIKKNYKIIVDAVSSAPYVNGNATNFTNLKVGDVLQNAVISNDAGGYYIVYNKNGIKYRTNPDTQYHISKYFKEI